MPLKRLGLFLLLATLAAPLWSPLWAAPAELLINSSFESGTSGWLTFGGQLVQVSYPVYGGSFAAAYTSADFKAKWFYQDVPVTSGAIYSFSGWAVKNSPNITEVKLRISWYSESTGYGYGQAAGSEISSITAAGLTSDSAIYRFVSTGEVEAPYKAIIARLKVILMPASSSTATAYFDGLSFVGSGSSSLPPTAPASTLSGVGDGAASPDSGEGSPDPPAVMPFTTPPPTPTFLPSPTPTIKPTPTPQPTQTPTIRATPTSRPTQTPTIRTTPTSRPTQTPTIRATPTSRPTQTPTIRTTPTPRPISTPTVTPVPTPVPTVKPSSPAAIATPVFRQPPPTPMLIPTTPPLLNTPVKALTLAPAPPESRARPLDVGPASQVEALKPSPTLALAQPASMVWSTPPPLATPPPSPSPSSGTTVISQPSPAFTGQSTPSQMGPTASLVFTAPETRSPVDSLSPTPLPNPDNPTVPLAIALTFLGAASAALSLWLKNWG